MFLLPFPNHHSDQLIDQNLIVMETLEPKYDFLLSSSMKFILGKGHEWFTQAESWKVELILFEKLLRIKNDHTFPPDDDQMTGLLQNSKKLKKEVDTLIRQVGRFENDVAEYARNETSANGELYKVRFSYTKRMVERMSRSIAVYKQHLLEFSESWELESAA